MQYFNNKKQGRNMYTGVQGNEYNERGDEKLWRHEEEAIISNNN
jgi:hypothetical protein